MPKIAFMGAIMTDLFPDLIPTRPTRRQPRVLMHVLDAGDHCGEHDGEVIAVMRCKKCGHETDWTVFRNVTEAKSGVPCPKRNT